MSGSLRRTPSLLLFFLHAPVLTIDNRISHVPSLTALSFRFWDFFQKDLDLATLSKDSSGREYTDQTASYSPMNQNDQMWNTAGSPDTLTTLDQVSPPGQCRVVSVPARGSIRKRLLAMGFIPGPVPAACLFAHWYQ